MKILVRRRALGDVVLLGAVTARLPGCTVVTEARFVALAARLRGVGRAVAWPEVPPGLVVDLQGDRRLRADRRIHKRSLRRRLRLLWSGVPARPPVPALYAEAAGVLPAPPPWFDLPDRPRTALALLPGASTPLKRWSPERFAALGRRWDGPVVVLGGPDEAALCRAVSDGIPGSTWLAEDGFDRTLDALAGARVAVGGDTGLLHLAGAAGAPVVALFGPTHPSDGFFVYPGEVVQRARWCRPCTLHRRASCPLGHHACMDLSVDDVWAAVLRCAG